MLPPERTAREVEGIARLLEEWGVPPDGAVLDLACGDGRHAIRLAQRGYRVTGQDFSQVFLRRAEEDARAAGVDVRWVHGDMRQIAFVLKERAFDQLSGRNRTRLTLIHPDGARREHEYKTRVYSATELARLCAAAALEVVAHYGGLDGSTLTVNSRRLVLACRRPVRDA